MDNTTLEVGNKIAKEIKEISSLIKKHNDCILKMDKNIEGLKKPVVRVNGEVVWENYLEINPQYVKIMLTLQLAEENEKLRVLNDKFKNLR